MEKRDAAPSKGLNAAIIVIYALFAAGLIGLLFVPSLFFAFGGYSFSGGQTVFRAAVLLAGDLIKNSNKFVIEFAPLAGAKWLIFALLGVILINLAVFFVILFTRSAQRARKAAVGFSAFSLLAFLGLSVFYVLKTGHTYYMLVTSPPVCMALLSGIVVLVLGIASKNFVKSGVFLLSLIAAAGLFYKSLNVLEYISAYDITVSYITKFKDLPHLISSMAQLSQIPKFAVIVFVYGIIAAAGLTALNLIFSAFGIGCKKVCVFDIVRFTLSLIVSALFFAVAVSKFNVALLKSYGFLAVLGATLIAAVLCFIFYFKKEKADCNCLKALKKPEEEPQDTAIPAFEFDFASVAKPYAEQEYQSGSVAADTAEQLQYQIKEAADSAPEQESPAFNAFKEYEPPVLEEEAVQLEIEREKAEPQKQPEIKQQEPPKKQTAEQLDIESLKAEILADLYMKERTQTAAEVQREKPPVIKPRYEIKEMPAAQEPKKMPYKNPYIQLRQESPPDRFYDSLSEAEKTEFTDLFIKKLYGDNKRLPDYVIGGDNAEFFSKVFIFIGRFRSVISESLLSKIYLYSVSI